MSIVVGYSPSKQGAAALRAGIRESRALGQDLVIASHAYHDPEHGRTVAQESEILAALRKLDPEDPPHVRVVSSSEPEVGDFLLETAQREDARLLVIGLRRKSPIGKLNLGASARRVLLGAPCPVLAVKDGRTQNSAA